MRKTWKVEIERKAERELGALLKSRALNQDDIQILQKWITEIEEVGLEAIWESRYWNDHELHSEWAGCRSSSFSFRGRIIYKVIDEEIVVLVVKVTTDHDYRR